MFKCYKTNKIHPDKKYINDTSELSIIYKIINICYDSLNAVEEIWQGNRLKHLMKILIILYIQFITE